VSDKPDFGPNSYPHKLAAEDAEERWNRENEEVTLNDLVYDAEWIEKQKRPYFDQLGAEIHPTNVEKGFWEEPVMMDKYVAKIALIHSELTEVLEALRKSQGTDKVTEEFADVLIRTFDLYYRLVEDGEADPELWGIMKDKMKINAARPAKHGNRWG
jgi:NTP pyrophosphatase (non-canonical NTP hydrolase)